MPANKISTKAILLVLCFQAYESPVHRGISETTEQHQYETPHLGYTATLR